MGAGGGGEGSESDVNLEQVYRLAIRRGAQRGGHILFFKNHLSSQGVLPAVE